MRIPALYPVFFPVFGKGDQVPWEGEIHAESGKKGILAALITSKTSFKEAPAVALVSHSLKVKETSVNH